jgi:hypothetical protein
VQHHLGRQSGVQKVEVSLLDGKVRITPKDDGTIDPAQLMKATYDSGVTVAEMGVTARGRIVKDPSGGIALRFASDRSFPIVADDASKPLESMAESASQVTLRGSIYKKPPGKTKTASASPFKLAVLEIQRKE